MSAPWRVGKYHPSEAGTKPWYACDRGGWFGNGLPGRSFKTHCEAFQYAFHMATLLGAAPDRLEYEFVIRDLWEELGI